MSKHTPGPWIAVNTHPTHDDIYYIQENSRGYEHEIAVLYNERGANARLIAAAPDLVAALSELHANSVSEPGYGGSPTEQRVIAALEKAGVTP